MRRLTRYAPIIALAALASAAAPVGAQQSYPNKPVTLLIPFPPGTGNDIVGRIVGNKLSETLRERVVADNRPGASGNIAVEATLRSAPDGYTLVMASTSFSINLFTRKINFGLSDFTPIARIGQLPYTLVVANNVPAKNIKELVQLLKSKKGQYNAGSGGATGTSFFLVEAFKKAGGFDLQLVAYKGTTAAVVDIMAGRVHVLFAPLVTSLPHLNAGKLRLLGISGSKRSALVPDVPTFNELGYPTLDIATWFAILGPKGVPNSVVKTLNEAVGKALQSKDVIQSLSKQGVEPDFGTPEQTAAFLKKDAEMWGKMVKESGIERQ